MSHGLCRILLLCLFLGITSCNKIVTDFVSGGGNSNLIHINVVSSTTAIADGFSELTLTLKIQDQLGHPISNRIITFDQNIELGINSLICTNTDSQGLSVCKIRSHRDGVKALKISDHSQIVKVEFIRSFDQESVLFDAVGASHSPMFAGPDLVSGSSGKRIDKPLIEESGLTLRSDPSVIH